MENTRTSGSSPSTETRWKMPERHRRQAELARAEIAAWPAWMRVSAVPPRIVESDTPRRIAAIELFEIEESARARLREARS